MTDHDDDDNENESESEFLPIADALEQSGFSLTQLRALVAAGLVKVAKGKRGVVTYCAEDLARLAGLPRVEEPEELPHLAEFRAVTDGYKAMLDIALRQTKQAHDHERALVQAFAKPLEMQGGQMRELLGAVLEQNKALVQRANDGDSARLEFVKAAETMLRDQRQELREQSELDRKHELKREVWEGVKKAGPHLLEGLKATMGGGAEKLAAVAKLKEKLDLPTLASILHFKLLDDEGIDALCAALGVSRADLEAINAEASAAEANAGDEPKAAE